MTDPVLPTDDGVIVLRPGKQGRRGEPEAHPGTALSVPTGGPTLRGWARAGTAPLEVRLTLAVVRGEAGAAPFTVATVEDRSLAGQLAPPQGLCLWEVCYP